MHAKPYFLCLGALTLVATGPGRAQDSRTTSSPNSTSSSTAAQKGRAARGPLPDPVLLDGSPQPAEKRPDYGMLGQFEIPGDADAKPGDKVGGQSRPPGSPAGGQQAAQQGGMPAGGGGGAPQQGAPQAGGGGAAGGQQAGVGGAEQANAAGGGAGGGAMGNDAMGGGGAGGPNDPNAKADGVQVSGLTGDASNGSEAIGTSGGVQKPQQVALGDPAMRIKPAPGAASAIGGAGASNSTQQMESKIGHGSGPGPSAGTDGRGGVEKGRVMPSGL